MPPFADYDPIDEDALLHQDDDILELVQPSNSDTDPDVAQFARSSGPDPGGDVLGLGPLPRGSRSSSDSAATPRPEQLDHGGDMKEKGASALAEDGLPDGVTAALRERGVQFNAIDASYSTSSNQLQQTAGAALAMRVHERSHENLKGSPDRPVPRVDSAQESTESVPQLPREKSPQRSERASNLTVLTDSKSPALGGDDSIAKSPTLSKHMIRVEEKVPSSLPPVQSTSPTAETPSSSTRKESLPGFQQLANLANIASQQKEQDPRQPAQHSHHHSAHSFSSATSQSPMIPYHPSYTNSAQTSPVSFHAYARSPTGEGFTYPSPSQNPGSAYYFPDRRTSIANDSGHTYPTPVPSLQSNPSSSESQVGNAGSSTDGYSTAHTTPIDPGSVPPPPPDAMSRPILPPPRGMQIIPAGGFTCDYAGCNSLPFQTQYLLSSHRNVHSQSRPHYCPVKDCPRSEGGKGFKRKNEMIRHGLVHSSPGYVCPFCPDREHRYPRPDNLQRHVRVHHVDKDRDDPQLREVLAQRSEGVTQKQRRRRTQGSSTSSRNGEGQAPELAP